MSPSQRQSMQATRAAAQAAAERALGAVGSRAYRYLVTPAALRASVSSVDPRTDTYERALHAIERRAVVLGTAPGHGTSSGDERPLPDPAAIDAWSVRPGELEARPKVISTCPDCDGQRKTKCHTCEGSGQVVCDTCDGAALLKGRACEACSGSGGIMCPDCHRGEIDCPTCGATGRVRAWLALEAKAYSHVAVMSDGSGIDAHPNVRSPSDFDAGPTRWKNELFHDTGTLPSAKGLPRELLPPLDPRMDRLRSTRVQSFASSVHRFPYDSPFGVGVLEVAGNPPQLTPATVWRPLRLRRAMLITLLVAGAWFALMLRHGYATRHPWFAEHGKPGLVLMLGLAAALAGVVAAGGLMLPARARSLTRTWLPCLVAAALATLAVASTRADGPTIADAEARLARGDRAAAKLEAEAVIALGGDKAAAARVVDAAHTNDLATAATLADAIECLALPWLSDDARASATAYVAKRGDDEIAALAAKDDVTGLFLLGETSRKPAPELARKAFATGAARRVVACEKDAIFPCEYHGVDLPDEVARGYERRLEVAYVDASIAKGDWDAAAARIDRWTGDLAQGAPAARARAAAATQAKLTALIAQARTVTEPHPRRDLADLALVTGRAFRRFAEREPSPPVSVLTATLASAERAVEAFEKAEVKRRGVWR